MLPAAASAGAPGSGVGSVCRVSMTVLVVVSMAVRVSLVWATSSMVPSADRAAALAGALVVIVALTVLVAVLMTATVPSRLVT